MGMWLFPSSPIWTTYRSSCLNSVSYALYIYRVHSLAMYGTSESKSNYYYCRAHFLLPERHLRTPHSFIQGSDPMRANPSSRSTAPRSGSIQWMCLT
ncbi:hypothetical protein BO85DRAFT_444084 [Aspergillus piperis CBS 112811]|uniref:Uncharacterized protein n=1 Tax=Aspergillus piperis CBS 112811 TaxID=1448313 RepID=A0A8G1RE39_9EURO|nr:hypothetical protein BO85DRAFT_444084 [Aspergillus piperis CBS 112811]RAH62745.1 hypothetical protein BO85DRAFT_444084 [Aspergillus piperis CBS 112811]